MMQTWLKLNKLTIQLVLQKFSTQDHDERYLANNYLQTKLQKQ